MRLSDLHLTYSQRQQYRKDFLILTADLLSNDLVLRLEGHRHHIKYSRLRHSMDVAYTSYVLARILDLDSVSVARGGLLHDLFFHEDQQSGFELTFSHPIEAASNAQKICALNAMEENIILGHMWPFTLNAPRYRESVLVSMVDKYCAIREIAVSLFTSRSYLGVDEGYLPVAVTSQVEDK